jgi:aminoglycoside 3-N-acetyltransferase
MQDNRNLYTQRQLVDQLRSLGVSPGQTVMLHASVKAVGQVMGGPDVILQALFEVLGDEGTLMMYAGWQDIPDFVLELPPDLRERYYADHPPFDPAVSRAVRDNSVLVEFFRTWPGTVRSQNPEASMVARGKQADTLTRDHPLNYGYGADSPLARLVALRGHVLLLGAPINRITLLHHAEYLAKLRHKNVIHYQCPILKDGVKTWVDIEDYDTGDPHDAYSFRMITSAYLEARPAQTGSVGDATCYLLDAADLTAFAVDWLESRFGQDSGQIR